MTTTITSPATLLTQMTAAQGVAGISAYAVAVKNGYTGTEAEWLLTLVGPAWPSTGVQAASEAARDAAVIAKDLAVAAKDTAVLSATSANDDAVAVALVKSSVDGSTTTVTELAAQVNIDVGVIAGYKDTAALDKAAVALDKAAVAADKLTVASYKDTVVLDKAAVALDKAAVAADKLTVSGYKDAVDTDRSDVALDKAAVAADKLTVAGYKDTVALDKADVALDKAAVAADKLTVSGYKDTVALDKAAVALDTATVAADKLTVAGYKDTVATDKTDTLGYKNSASDSAVAAALSASNADTSEAMAQAWAITPTDTVVSGSDYSALHWAAKSAESQGIAGSFATSANDAKVSAQAAAASAVAVVTGGTASLTSAAGKIPIADSIGKIDVSWLDLLPASNNAPLHCSPNAITAMFVYDASKDSDGGAWIEKCQHTSWYNEPLCGKWLGRLVSEAAARAVTGAVTSDYYQLTTDGKFYKLNAVSGVTEVFRGNKRKWPLWSVIVGESSGVSYANVAIYDLTEPGCPMFMAFSGASGGIASGNMLPRYYAFGGSLGYTCCSAINGLLLFGSDTIGFATVRLLEDSATLAGGEVLRYLGNISQRNSAKGFKAASATHPDRFNHRGGWCNSIAVCLPSSAPTDPATGLTIPLIATAGSLGLSVFYPNSWSAYSSSAANYHRVTLTPRLLSACVSTDGNWFTAVSPEKLPSNFALSSNTASDALDFNQGNTTGLKSISQSALVRSSGALLQLMRSFDSSPSIGVSATVAPTYATGYMVGDIRRCYIAGITAGTVSNPATLPDRSYKAATATVYGSLTAALVATGAQLVTYTGFSVANYLREPYSADLDFGTDEWSIGALVQYLYGSRKANLAKWSEDLLNASWVGAGRTVTPAAAIAPDGTNTGFCVTETNSNGQHIIYIKVDTVAGANSGGIYLKPGTRRYVAVRLDNGNLPYAIIDTVDMTVNGPDLLVTPAALGWYFISTTRTLTGPGYITVDLVLTNTIGASTLYAGDGVSTVYLWHPQVNHGPVLGPYLPTTGSIAHEGAPVAARSFESGPRYELVCNGLGNLQATAFDGTTTRTVTSPVAYNTNTPTKVVANYRAGRLALEVNGVEVAVTNGAPLLTLNNSNAVLTIGNSYDLSAPFPGSITLVKLGATVPTPEQSLWMYEQEKSMFREGAQVCLPEATAVADLTYDPQTDKWTAVQAGNESSWVGLTRVSTSVPSAGTFSKAETKSGIKLLSRATTSPGVDVSISGQTLIESLSKRAEAANLLNKQSQVFDFDTVGFTCTTVNGQNTMTSVASLVGTPYIGMYVIGAGIPTGTYLIGINGTTYYMSANATASNTVVTTGQASFTLPAGFTAIEVVSAGSRKREGSTKDWTRSYDGFRETVRFAASPGSAAWVQITAKKD